MAHAERDFNADLRRLRSNKPGVHSCPCKQRVIQGRGLMGGGRAGEARQRPRGARQSSEEAGSAFLSTDDAALVDSDVPRDEPSDVPKGER